MGKRIAARGPRLVVTAWDLNPDVTSFVYSRLGLLSQAEIHARAIAQFGADRVPSRSALNRFAMRKEQRNIALARQAQARASSAVESS